MTYDAPNIVEILKSRYPAPEVVHKTMATPGSYCVGGSLLKFLGAAPNPENGTYFPSSSTIVLHVCDLTGYEGDIPDRIYSDASRLVALNDGGNFEGAWGLLQKIINDIQDLTDAEL